MKAWLTTLLMILLLAPPAWAAGYEAVAQLGPGYVHEDGRTSRMDFTWDQPFHLVGFVAGFEGRLDYLQADEPGVEYTWAVMNSLSCGGVLGHTQEGCPVASLDAAGGWFRLVRDTTPDADLADPSTFCDGEVLLEGVVPALDYEAGTAPISLVTWGCNPGNQGTDFLLRVVLDGGALWPDLGLPGSEALSLGTGTFEAWSQLPQEILDAGYFARTMFELRVEGPVATHPTTWGRLKRMY